MIEPNKGVSTDKLELLRQESYERMSAQLKTAIEQKLTDFQMTWDDLATKLGWMTHYLFTDGSKPKTGIQVKGRIGCKSLSVEEMNDIAHVFSAEMYVIFRPRFPWIAT